MATINAQIFKSSSLQKYKALCDTSVAVKEAFVIVDDYEDNKKLLYYAGEPLTVDVDEVVTEAESISGTLDDKSYKFSVPTADGSTLDIVLENAWLPEIGNEESGYEMKLINDDGENIDDNGRALYSNGLLSTVDKYKIEILWKALKGKINMSGLDSSAYVYDYSYLDYKIAFSQQDAGPLTDDGDINEDFKWYTVEKGKFAEKELIPVVWDDAKNDYYYESDSSTVTVDIAHDEDKGDVLQNFVEITIPATRVYLKEREWIKDASNVNDVVVEKLTSSHADIYHPEYDLEKYNDTSNVTCLMADHGGLDKGTTAQDVKETYKTISGVLNAILYGAKAKFHKIQDAHCEIIPTGDVYPMNVHPGMEYPKASDMDVKFYNEVWRLYNADGTPVLKDGEYVDVTIYEEPQGHDKCCMIFDAEHAEHPRHWHYMTDEEKEAALRFNPPYLVTNASEDEKVDPESYYWHYRTERIKENDKCVYFGICHATKKAVQPSATTIDGEVVYPYSEFAWENNVAAEIHQYTRNAWTFGDHYSYKKYEEKDDEMVLVDTSAYWRMKPATVENAESKADYIKDYPGVNNPDVHFFDMDEYLTFSPIYANVNVEGVDYPEVSLESLYQYKNVEPKDYVPFNTSIIYDEEKPDKRVDMWVEGLNNTEIYSRDNEEFYIKWPSATMDASHFVVAVPHGFAIEPFVPVGQTVCETPYVGTAHDTYDEKYTIPVGLSIIDSSVTIKTGKGTSDEDFYRVIGYTLYKVEKVGGITTAAIKLVKTPED